MQYLISMPTLIAVLTAPLNAQQLVIVDNLPGTFIDISNSDTSTPLGLGDDDEILVQGSVVGNNMVLPTSSMVIANNGGVGFRNPTTWDLEPINQPIPSGSAFGGAQATLVFWDDIDDKTGDVYFDQFADRMIIQWNDRILGGTGATVDFQIQIFEQIGPLGIVAQYLFRDVEQPGILDYASTTIGYQDGGVGYGDYQWSFNVAGAVGNGTVLSLVLSASSIADVIDLGTLGGNTSRAYAVNDLGHVAGQAETVSGDMHAFLWLPEPAYRLPSGMTGLGTLGGNHSAAFGVNNEGQVVGRADTATAGVYHAFLWDPQNGMQDLGALGGQLSEAYAVNDLGEIVGRAQNADGFFRAFYRWAEGTTEWLGLVLPGDQESAGFAIGDGNLHMAGASSSAPNHAFAFGGEAGLYVLEDLGFGSTAYGLDGLQRVGSVTLESSAVHAALWDIVALTELGTLGGTNSRAFAINNADQIVGESDIAMGSKHAFRWQDGVMTDLNTLLAQRDGWVLGEARAINEVGQIVGEGTINGEAHAFLITPRAAAIPLLSSWALIIATLLLLTAGSLIVIWRSAGHQTARGVLPSRRF